MFDTIGLGDWVTIRTPHGEQTGRAVIHNNGVRLWVLNMDGKPWLATPDSVVKVVKARTPPELKMATNIVSGQRACQNLPAASSGTS